jgi:hypothetical protein
MPRTDWLEYPYYKLPDPELRDVPLPYGGTTKMASVEYDLAVAISQDIRGVRRFLYAPEDLEPQYRSPAAYRANLIAYADSLMHFSYSSFIMPAGWNAEEAGTRYAKTLCDTLKNIPVNKNYPETNNVYDAWIDGSGQFYGGVRP